MSITVIYHAMSLDCTVHSDSLPELDGHSMHHWQYYNTSGFSKRSDNWKISAAYTVTNAVDSI